MDVSPADLNAGGGGTMGAGQAKLRAGAEGAQGEAAELQVVADALP